MAPPAQPAEEAPGDEPVDGAARRDGPGVSDCSVCAPPRDITMADQAGRVGERTPWPAEIAPTVGPAEE